jgi:hypothetical protein
MELVPPITKTDITTLTSFEINSVNVILNTSADILIYLKNSDNVIVASEMVVIEGADYANWGSEDNYIVNYISNYLRTKYIV